MVLLSRQKAYLLVSRLGTISMIVMLFAYFAITMPTEWLSLYNLRNLVEQTVSLGLLAVGLTIVRAAGEMDMSVGAMMSLGSMVSMGLVLWGQSVWLPIAITVAVGGLGGLANGLMRAKARLPGVIPTLGSRAVLSGLALLCNGGSALYGVGPGVTTLCELGRGSLGPISIPGSVLLGGVVLCWWLLGRTRYGRLIYMVGGNSEAAKFSGVRVDRVVVIAYTLCGIYAAAAGVMVSGRLGAGNPFVGNDLLLDAIIAVMVGSTVLAQEQEFSPFGSLAGAFFVTFVNSGMQMAGQGYPAQCILRGVLLLGSLALFSLQKRAVE